jgi:hypothetical protein
MANRGFWKPPQPIRGEHVAKTAEEICEIEAQPRDSKEPRLKDALHTIEEYLRGKPKADVFEWPRRPRLPLKGRPPKVRSFRRSAPPEEADFDDFTDEFD